MGNNSLPTFHIARRPEDHIIVVSFDDFSRSVVEQWAAHVRAADGKLRSPLRLLYDFRKAGPPGPYALSVVGPLMRELTIPHDTRNAYLFKNRLDTYFAHSIIRNMPTNVGLVKAFINFDEAIEWLREGLNL